MLAPYLVLLYSHFDPFAWFFSFLLPFKFVFVVSSLTIAIVNLQVHDFFYQVEEAMWRNSVRDFITAITNGSQFCFRSICSWWDKKSLSFQDQMQNLLLIHHPFFIIGWWGITLILIETFQSVGYLWLSISISKYSWYFTFYSLWNCSEFILSYSYL